MKKPLFILLLVLVNTAAVYFLFFTTTEYELIPIKKVTGRDVVVFKYEDLDGDGTREEIYVRDFDNIYSIFNISSEKGFVSDLKVEGKIKSSGAVLFHDMDYDGVKEIWSITRFQDTLRLNFSDLYAVKESYPIIPVDPNYSLENYDYLIEIAGIYDELLIFSINAGYPLEPRAIYSFNWMTGELKRTKDKGSLILNPYLFDLNRDGEPEVITRSFAPENIHYDVQYTDSSSWLRIFDLQLNHFFDPIEYPHNTCKIYVFPISSDTANSLAVSSYYGEAKGITPSISIINEKGKVAVQKNLNNGKLLFQLNENLYTYNLFNYEFYRVDENLQEDKFMLRTNVVLNPKSLLSFHDSTGFLYVTASDKIISAVSKDLKSEINHLLDDPVISDPIWNDSTVIARTNKHVIFLNIQKRTRIVELVGFVIFLVLQTGGVLIYTKTRKLTTAGKNAIPDHIIFPLLHPASTRIKIPRKNVIYLETAENYTNVFVTDNKKPLLVKYNLGKVEKEILPKGFFVRISREHIVFEDRIETIDRKKREVIIDTPTGKKVFKVSKSRLSDLPF